MTNPIERSPRQPIRDLVPRNVSLESKSLEGLRNLPHIQRVAGLVFLLLVAESVSREQFKNEFEKYRDTEINGIKTSFKDFVLSTHTNPIWPLSDELNNKKLPEIIAEKLNERGNPFGFEPKLTQAILEMAKDELQRQIHVDSIKIGSYCTDTDWKPDPISYFENVMVAMLEEGHLSGMSPFSNTEFPAGEHHREIFPKEVAQQMRDYIEQKYKN